LYNHYWNFYQSVLQQQASRNLKCECNLSSLQAANLGIENQNQQLLVPKENGISGIHHQHGQQKSSISLFGQQQQQQLQQQVIKKQGVSGESCDVHFAAHSSDILIRKYEKDFK